MPAEQRLLLVQLLLLLLTVPPASLQICELCALLGLQYLQERADPRAEPAVPVLWQRAARAPLDPRLRCSLPG